MIKTRDINRKNSNPLSDNEKTESNQWQSLTIIDNQMAIKAILAIKNSAFSPLRLSRISYQPSLIDVEINQINTTLKTKTIVKYRLYNYHQKSIKMNFIAKNIGTYIKTKIYSLKAHETCDDQIEFDQNNKTSDMTSNMLGLTVKASETDWNYDVISL